MGTIFGAGVFVSVAYLLSAMAATLNRSHGSSRKSLVMFDAIMTAVSLVLSFVLIFISVLTMAPLLLLLESQNSEKVRYGAVHICLMSIQVFVGVAQIILIL